MAVHMLHALLKRHPSHCAQRVLDPYGQSKRFERMFCGTSTSMPPTASINFMNAPKSTTTT
jgi:hypothetical protein